MVCVIAKKAGLVTPAMLSLVQMDVLGMVSAMLSRNANASKGTVGKTALTSTAPTAAHLMVNALTIHVFASLDT